MKKKLKIFSVSLLVKVDTNIKIQADSLEQAIEKARLYEVKDIVEFDTEYNDGSIKVTGAYDYSELAQS